jgi:hypothetical protein
MPWARYFFYVGGVLLMLLMIADSYLPKPPVAAKPEAHLPTIRLYSLERGPALVVIDTRVQTILPAQAANPEHNIALSAKVVVDSPPESTQNDETSTGIREAFAELRPTDTALQPADPKMSKPKPRHQRKIAKRYMQPTRLVWRQSTYGWYGSGYAW